MHDSEGKQLNAEIDFCGVILNLLSEWKAILLVSIVTAIVFSGIKFNVDKKEYDAKVEKIKQIEENMTENEEKEVLNTFSSIDRAPIELLLSQQEWVKAQKEYLDNSILFNSDPTNQRTLFIPVLIYDCEDASMPAVYKSYSFLVNDEKFLEIIGKEIDRDADLRFIKELISIDEPEEGSSNTISTTDNVEIGENKRVIIVKVVLPEDIEVQPVENAVRTAISDEAIVISETIAHHSIKILNTETINCYNAQAVTAKTNIMYAINNLQASIKNNTALISGEQQTALKTISRSLNADDSMTSQSIEEKISAIETPKINKKAIAVGAIFGFLMYTFIYCMYVYVRKRINSPRDVDNYLGGRLLGELYLPLQKTGRNTLLNSRIVSSFKLQGKKNVGKQEEKIIDTICAKCKHIGADEITFMIIIDLDENVQPIMNRIITRIEETGIAVKSIRITEESSDSDMLNCNNVVCILGRESKIKEVCIASQLMREYDVNNIGNVYIEKCAY